MKNIKTKFIIIIYLLALINIGFAQDENDYDDSPKVIINGDFADPSVVKDGDDYYMTNTSTNYFPGLKVWHSKDLIHWTPIAYALNKFVGEVWAPDLIKHGDKFYIYFPAYPGTNWVVTADSPYGPWSDPVDLEVTGIDPGHVVGPDGKRYLYFNHGNVAQLSDDGLSLVEEPKHVYDGWEYPSDWTVECFCAESPKLNFVNGYYYLTTAQGGTAGPSTSHMIVQARSKSVLGPWENSPYNPIIHTYSSNEKYWSKGHGTIVEAPNGGYQMFYHAYINGEQPQGRVVLSESIELTNDGWFVTKRNKKVEPEFKLIPNLKVKSNDFNSKELDLQWQFTNVNSLDKIKLENGKVLLETANDTLKVMHVISPSSNYEVEIEIESEGDVKTGLVLFYREHAYIGLQLANNKIERIGSLLPYPSPVIDAEGIKYLKLRVNDYDLTMFTSKDGANWDTYPNSANVNGYQHNILGKFSSLKPAVFWKGKGNIKIDNFRFKPIDTGCLD